MNFGFAGRFQFETFEVDEQGEEIPNTRKIRVPWFDNLITNVGLNQLGTAPGNQLQHCRIGTGSTAPANGDTTLVAQVGSTNTDGAAAAHGWNNTGKYMWKRVTKRFAANTVASVNLAEVGMSFSSTGTNLWSRALITAGGTPTTITLSSVEVLDVIYELRCYVGTGDITASPTIDGVSSTVTMRPHFGDTSLWVEGANQLGNHIAPQLSAYSSSIGCLALENQPAESGSVSGGVTMTNSAVAYVADSRQRVFQSIAELGSANFGTGIGCLAATNGYFGTGVWGVWSWGFSPKLNKNSTRTATIRFGMSWDRHTP